MRLEVTPAELAATVGEPVVLQVEVYNSRPVIDGYQATLLGLPGLPFTSEPPELSLFPETTGVMMLSFTLPPMFPAGQHVMGVKVASVIDPGESAAREVRLNVAPVTAATLTAEPLAVTGGKRAEYSLTVTNQGNVPLDAQLRAADSLSELAFRIAPEALSLAPGERGVAQVTATGKRPFFGTTIPHQLTFTADGLPQPLQAATTFMQNPLVPRGVLTLLSILAALAMWGVVLLLGVNKISDVVKEDNEAEAAAELQERAGPFAALPGGGGVLASVTGKVTAAPDATDATVSLIPVAGEGAAPAGEIPAPVTTPASGQYTIENVPSPAIYQIVFSKVGLGTQSRLVELKLGEQLTGVDVALVGGSAAVSGTVSEGDGPVGAATVTAANGTDTITTVSSPTSPVGTFALTGLPAPATYAISVAKEGFGTETMVVALAPNQKLSGMNMTITEGRGSISGTVLSKAGLPVPDVLVTVRAGAGTVPTSIVPLTSVPPDPLEPSEFGPDVLGAATSLAEGPVGFFSISGLPTPGTFTVTFQKEGYLLATATTALEPDGNETALSPVLQPVTGVVAGTVAHDIVRAVPCDPLACPLPEVQVKVTDRNGSEVRNTTTASSPEESLGRFEIAGLAAGPYTITFSKTGYVPQTLAVTLVDDEPVRVLDVTLRGVAVPVSGSAPNCSSVDIVLRDGRALNPPVGAAVRGDGSYRITRLASPGEYRAVFRDGGGSADFDLGAGETDVMVDGACVPPTTSCFVVFCSTTTTEP